MRQADRGWAMGNDDGDLDEDLEERKALSRDASFVATLSRSLNRRMTAAVTRSLARVASVAAVGVLAGALALLAAPVGASAGTTERVSVDSAGNQGNRGGGAPSLSADGRFVAFFSGATDLVAGATNWARASHGFHNPPAAVFVHHRVPRP